MAKSRYYVGCVGVTREVFTFEGVPSQATHGKSYFAAIGPFKTKRAAEYCANNRYSPAQTVAEFEEIVAGIRGAIHVIEITPNGDPYGSGFTGSESLDGGTSWVYRGDIGARSRRYWRWYAKQQGAVLRFR